jgi:HD-like signal output (HDOD) protein
MFGWLKRGSKAPAAFAPTAGISAFASVAVTASVPPSPRASVRAPARSSVKVGRASAKRLVKASDLNLITVGAPRVEAAGDAEKVIATKFCRIALDCRTTFTDGSFDLPNLPGSAAKLLNLMQEPKVSTNRLARAILTDPVLTAKFLRTANSPVYACDYRIKSVQVAIERLGMDMVNGVLLAIAVQGAILSAKRLGPAAGELWNHSFSSGLAAQSLAALLKLDQADAFVLGLMHDVGKLPALLLADDLIAKGLEVNSGFVQTLVEDAHPLMGQAMCEIWRMPDEICLVVGAHHVVNSGEEAVKCWREAPLKIMDGERLAMAKLLQVVILADRSLGALGLARESGDLTVLGSRLAQDVGLSPDTATYYLKRLPGFLKANDLRAV